MCWSTTENLELPTTSRHIPRDDVRGIIANERAVPWIRTVVAAWQLLKQGTTVDIIEKHAPRHARRRAKRDGRQLPPVRVVSIHRRASEAEPPTEPSGRKLSVRFDVDPFERNQAYGPGRSLRKVITVKKHQRGPKDAPVRNRPKVVRAEQPPAQDE